MSLPDGPFTASHACLPSKRITSMVERGELRRLFKGVYVDPQVPDTLALRASALALVVPQEVVVTDATAAWLHEVDVLMPGEHLVVPDVQAFHRSAGCRIRRGSVASGERSLLEQDVMEIGGVRVTTPLRTALDLGRHPSLDRSFAQAEAMVRAGVDRDELLGELPRFNGYRWVRNLRAVTPWLDPRPHSLAESITRKRAIWLGPPYPEPQRPVLNPQGDEWLLDMGYDELFLAIEYDGEEFHTEEEAQQHDAERRIRRNTPWMIEVVTRKNLFGRHQDFDVLLPRWLAEARRTLLSRLRRPGRWYDEIGD